MAFRDHPLTKWTTEYVVQGQYGRGWDDLHFEQSWSEGHRALKEYEDHDVYAEDLRLITRKIPNPDYGRFRVGGVARVHPGTTAFMQRITAIRITHVGRGYIRGVWTMNESVSRRFAPELLEPLDEYKRQQGRLVL